MANLDGLTAAELRAYLSGQTKKLKLLKTVLIVAIVVVVVSVIAHIIYYFNYLTNLNFDVLTAKSKVESAMQYRANLIPLLIESVVSFVEHEDNVFNSVVDGRERSLQATRKPDLEQLKKSVKDLSVSNGFKGMDTLMDKIIAFAEQYPDLKTAEPFQLLMAKASDTEAEIYAKRIEMTDAVNLYTTSITMFPGNFYANVMFNFPDYEYFKGELYSEWPHFRGKSHSGWPKVSIQQDSMHSSEAEGNAVGQGVRSSDTGITDSKEKNNP
ncbi:Putative LemA family protein, magnetosome protein MamQ [Desulfamplus magnetovallimortis]|uniref:Magnetosome protein n=2 Tax=Desulfamplus magnetovallimortis TaxID=1246637 RepID=G8IQU4_9BACT|nr:LemA family protein [Desulfamplus magnetovallimortis]AET24917.1 magnetosome protein [Desulfamplus magnetovallimortis BW-1]CCO06711.1 Putative LemA family protein, magnetosome protein MamQ [Desulfamplus magnetovallimortis BW-1]SLM32762.1 Putative LemA family protein, magnetosome protein MamQ [Desulfamplus magnetovallimortis]